MPSARHITRPRRAILSVSAIMFGIIGGSTTQAAQASDDPQDCVQRTVKELATYNKLAARFVSSGKLTREQADLYRCHPELALKNAPVKVKIIPSDKAQRQDKTALAAGCKSSSTLVEEYGSPTALVHESTLNWCYDGRRVSDWSGNCDPSVTGWGTTLGWSSGGCTRNDFIPYTLRGYYPGGVDHVTRGTFNNNYTPSPAVNMTIYIWGHGDGTCDHRSGSSGTIYHYC